MGQNKNLLLLVDFQNDFCMPDGSLFVPGAVEDVSRTARFIHAHINYIDHMVLTGDSHQVMDISHPLFWRDKNGNPPRPFTQITYGEIVNGKWEPVFFRQQAVEYVNRLEQNGEFTHTIWPEHCIAGSGGAAITDEIMQAVIKWARKGHYFDMITKGTYPLTEHFGVLRANIPSQDAPESQLNTSLIQKLSSYENVIIAGEAKSHCVANTLKQLLELNDFGAKLIILDDCMSNIPGFEHVATNIFEEITHTGALITKSTEFSLS